MGKSERLTFGFKVGSSFLNADYQHPITIKKEVYGFWGSNGISTTDNAVVTFPNGASASAYIKKGVTRQRGLYYQIRIRGGITGVAEFRVGDDLTIEMENIDDRIAISIARA